ncbi:MAG: SBBP repeat-containing protein [Candidatus Thorarchaeota archaeon]
MIYSLLAYRKKIVICSLALLLMGSICSITFTFGQVPDFTYNLNDNEILEFSSYLGGTGDESGASANLNYLGDSVVDSEGNIIVVGRTSSTDFPVKDALQATNHGNIDITISKFSVNGSLIFSTYFGGSENEWATGVALDSSDNIVFAGTTGSPDFPLKSAYQSTLLGGSEGDADCFVAKISKDGQSLLYSTYFGGTGSDWCYTMAVDANNRIAITGTTYSSNLPLVNPFQSTNKGQLDCFVTLFAANGQSVIFSTLLGGTGADAGRGIIFDENNDIFLTGQMGSCTLSTSGVFQVGFGGGAADAYVAKFKANGSLEFYSFLGGTGYDRANGIALDSQGNILITGHTTSPDFPTANPYQAACAGSLDVFVAKIDPLGQNLNFSTYIGGSSSDNGYSITLDSEDNIVVTGQTNSLNYPTNFEPLLPISSGVNILASKLSSDGSTLLFSSMIGGTYTDVGVSVSWYDNDSFIILGFTYSTDLPTSNAFQEEFGGVCDMFIMKVEFPNILPTETANSISFIGISFTLITSILIILIDKKKIEKN